MDPAEEVIFVVGFEGKKTAACFYLYVCFILLPPVFDRLLSLALLKERLTFVMENTLLNIQSVRAFILFVPTRVRPESRLSGFPTTLPLFEVVAAAKVGALTFSCAEPWQQTSH